MVTPNVIWITLDSVRSDHTTLDGYKRETTPNIQELGTSGHAFVDCISHAKSTLPSSGAILTGYAPSRTNIGIQGNVVPDGIKTIPERFHEIGYQTACISRNSFLSSATGLDQGFNRFQWLASSTLSDVGLRTLLKYVANIRTHSAGLTLDTAKHASPLLVNELAKDWVDEFASSTDPFFFYLHYNEPHRPYYPPGKYLDRFTEDIAMEGREAAEFALDVHYHLDEIVADGCNFADEEWDALKAMYDAEIAYTDEMVGDLIEYVRSLDTGPTVVVITADHGELFGEHDLLSHSYVLSDAVTRVPLVIDGLPDEVELAAGASDLVQHADVMRTLLELAGGSAPDSIGVDLRETVRDFAVSQRGPADFQELLRHNASFDTDRFHSGTMTALRTDRFRYQRSADRQELFELPFEENDVASERPDLLSMLDTKLDQWLSEHGEPLTAGVEDEFSGAVERQLRDLGYLN